MGALRGKLARSEAPESKGPSRGRRNDDARPSSVLKRMQEQVRPEQVQTRFGNSREQNNARKKEASGTANSANKASEILGSGALVGEEKSVRREVDSARSAAEGKDAVKGASTPSMVLSSLTKTSPSAASSAYRHAERASVRALDGQRSKAKQALPKLPTPTGLAPKIRKPPSRTKPGFAKPAAKVEAKAVRVAASGAKQVLPVLPEQRLVVAPAATRLRSAPSAAAEDQVNRGDAVLAQDAQLALAKVSLPVEQVATQVTTRAELELVADADPTQIDRAQAQARADLFRFTALSRLELDRPRGEDEIAPRADPELLESRIELKGAGDALGGPSGGAGGNAVQGDVMAVIDANAGIPLGDRLSQGYSEYQEGEAEYARESLSAHESAALEIHTLETRTVAEQRSARSGAQQASKLARAQWSTGIGAITEEFEHESERGRVAQQRGILAAVEKGERDANTHFDRAQVQAQEKKQRQIGRSNARNAVPSRNPKGFGGGRRAPPRHLSIGSSKRFTGFMMDFERP